MRGLLAVLLTFAALTLASYASVTVTQNAGPGGTLSAQNADNVAIAGGTIDGTTIGGTTAAAGTFTSVTANSTVNVPSGGTVSVVKFGANDTGIYASTVNTINFKTGGANVGNIDSSGFWNATIGLRVTGSQGIQATSGLTMATGTYGIPKITTGAAAPGAAGARIELVCGTNAGTAKLIVYAGTSTTPVTITDNIGGGVTGC